MKKLLPTIYNISVKLDNLFVKQKNLEIVILEKIMEAQDMIPSFIPDNTSKAHNSLKEDLFITQENLKTIILEKIVEDQVMISDLAPNCTPKTHNSLDDVINLIYIINSYMEETIGVIKNELDNVESKLIYSSPKPTISNLILRSMDHILLELDKIIGTLEELSTEALSKLAQVEKLIPEIYNIFQVAINNLLEINLITEESVFLIKDEIQDLESRLVSACTKEIDKISILGDDQFDSDN